MFQQTEETSQVTTGFLLSNTSSFQKISAVVTIVISSVVCTGPELESFTCAVRINNTWVNGTTEVQVQRKLKFTANILYQYDI